MEYCTRCGKPIVADADVDAYMLGQMCADCLAEPEPKPKRKTYTSPEVKSRWNKKTYDTTIIRTRKGLKPIIKAYAENQGVSLNALYLESLFKCHPELKEKSDQLKNGCIII